MRKFKGMYILSNTDRRRIEAHTRALARKSVYDGHIEAWFNPENGGVHYYEIVGTGYMEMPKHYEAIFQQNCYSWR